MWGRNNPNEPMTPEIETAVTAAEAAAVATDGPHGLNVVPISVFEAVDGEVRICHFFLRKTIENITANPTVAFTCWAGLSGVQVHAQATVEREGELFRSYQVRMKERFPERTLQAVVRLMPIAVYSVTPGEAGRALE